VPGILVHRCRFFPACSGSFRVGQGRIIPSGCGRYKATGERMLTRVFPFLGWFKGYTGESLRADLISGLTVALVLIPQSMAYAQLAGLPPYYGLYASFLPPLVAALFGSSRQLATGPVAVVSLMTSASLAPLATQGSEAYIAYAIMLALMVGLFQLALGVLRLGLVVNFLSTGLPTRRPSSLPPRSFPSCSACMWTKPSITTKPLSASLKAQ
jgi:hypothetical protein